MRIDLPTCGFKLCRYCFDGNCINKVEYDRCEYRAYKDSLQVHGRWEGYFPYCSVCGEEAIFHDNGTLHGSYFLTDYCPNCGAKMDVIKTDNKPDQSLLFASLEDIIDATD